jgi:hypothetical protein
LGNPQRGCGFLLLKRSTRPPSQKINLLKPLKNFGAHIVWTILAVANTPYTFGFDGAALAANNFLRCAERKNNKHTQVGAVAHCDGRLFS